MTDYKTTLYKRHFITGLEADIKELVQADFHVMDLRVIEELFDTITILRLASRILPSYAWKECCTRRNGMIHYKRTNDYLENYIGTRLKANLAMQRLQSFEKKKAALAAYVAPLLHQKKSPDADIVQQSGNTLLPPSQTDEPTYSALQS